jgi:hypothetical protein
MPTIEELFRSKKLVSGQTAEQQYDIRNTADLRRNPYNVLMTPSFRIAEVGRRNLSLRTRERRLEEEVTGLRILSKTTSPFLYGTDIIKFTKKSRGIVEDMKGGAGGVASAGILGTFLNKAEKFGKDILSKIGVKLPEQLIPSRIVLNKDFIREGGEYNTMVTLANLKSESGGNFLGKLLANNLQGRPNENQLIGSALDLGKKKLNNLLLGSPSQAAVNFAKAGGVIYDSVAPYSKVVSFYLTQDAIDIRNDLSTKYNNYEYKDNPAVNKSPALPSTNTILVQNVIKNPKTRFSELIAGMNVTKGIRTKSDYLNQQVAYPSKDGLTNDLITETEKQLDDYDFITLKFWSVYKKAAVNFRATLSGLTENLSPSWDSNRFVGNPFNFYTYNNIERKLNFSFKIYSLGYEEHIAAWQRINFLTSLVYPQEIGPVSITPPFIKFTLGDMFKNKEAFIESLTYTVDDNTTWEVGLNGSSVKNFKLPTIINVDISLTLVETIGSTYKQRLYGYGEADSSTVNKSDETKFLNPDGSPIPKKDRPVNKTVTDNGKEQKPVNPSEQNPAAAPKPKYTYEYRVIDKKPRVTVFKDGVRIDGASFNKNYKEQDAVQDLITRNKTNNPGIIDMKRLN